MTAKTTINKPSDAAVKKAKVALVKEVGLSFLNEIKSITRGFEDFPLTTSGKSDIKDPTAVINIRYIGEWRYCQERKRLHLTGSVATLLNDLVKKYTERYTKFVIEWSTDDKAWVTITIKNKQPATLAILNGGLSPAQQKAADKVAKDLELVEGVTDELEYQLRNHHPFSNNYGNIAREWRRTNSDEGKAVIEIEIRQYGEYEYMDECGKFDGHEDYFMSAETFNFFKEALATVGRKHPKVDISWHEGGKEWVYIRLEMKDKTV